MLNISKVYSALIAIIVLSAVGLWLFFSSAPPNRDNNDNNAEYHYSYYSQKEFFDKAYAEIKAKPETPKEKVYGLVVNHHLLARDLIAQAFQGVETDKPVTVVLISPNHFFAGYGQIITSEYDWQTPYGVLAHDQEVIDQLEKTDLVNVDESPFEKEHGISNIVAFIKKSLPRARIVPLVIKDTLSTKQADALAEELKNILPEDSLVVGSLDFSHKKTSAVADQEDAKSLAAIENFDFGAIKGLDVDSRPGLLCLLRYFAAKNAAKFTLLVHTNSSKLLGKLDSTETTSYITGYFSP